jgi:hypothetical protein
MNQNIFNQNNSLGLNKQNTTNVNYENESIDKLKNLMRG